MLKLKPQLARQYERACKKVYNKNIYVVEARYRTFEKTEIELRKRRIFPKDYALGISEKLREWVAKQGWSYVPMNVFCSRWAMDMFEEEISNKSYEETPEEEVDEGELLHEELTVARYYIEENTKRIKAFRKAVEELSPGLSDEWLSRYQERKRGSLRSQALDVLSEEHGKYIRKYDDLIQ